MNDSPSITLRDCLEEINHALNHWYPVSKDATQEEYDARHVRLFQFRDRLHSQVTEPKDSLTWQWTTEQPKEYGFYWFRWNTESDPDVVKVFLDEEDGIDSVRFGPCADDVNFLANYNGQWCGPIPAPMGSEADIQSHPFFSRLAKTYAWDDAQKQFGPELS